MGSAQTDEALSAWWLSCRENHRPRRANHIKIESEPLLHADKGSRLDAYLHRIVASQQDLDEIGGVEASKGGRAVADGQKPVGDGFGRAEAGIVES